VFLLTEQIFDALIPGAFPAFVKIAGAFLPASHLYQYFAFRAVGLIEFAVFAQHFGNPPSIFDIFTGNAMLGDMRGN